MTEYRRDKTRKSLQRRMSNHPNYVFTLQCNIFILFYIYSIVLKLTIDFYLGLLVFCYLYTLLNFLF